MASRAYIDEDEDDFVQIYNLGFTGVTTAKGKYNTR